jgi:hypothetical protein
MPNIKVFDAPIVGLDIPDRGAEAFSAASHVARQMGVQAKHSLDEAGREIGGGLEAVGTELRREARLKDGEDKVSKADLLQQNTQSNNDALSLSMELHASYTDAMNKALKADKFDPDWHKTWVRAKEQPGSVKLTATHPYLGTQQLQLELAAAPPEIA